MPNAIRKMAAPRPRQPKTNGFDYDKVGEATAEQMRDAADCVRRLMRDSVVEIGRELLKIKGTQIEHGQFTEWVRLECRLSIRTAERAIQAAKLVAKNDKLSYLPADGLLALSSRAAEPVAAQIIKRIEAGERPTAAEIKREIRAAAKGENSPSPSKDPLDQIQDAITKLNEGQLRRLAEWFDQFRGRKRAGADSEPESAFTSRAMFALSAPAGSPLAEQAAPPLLEQVETQMPERAELQLLAGADESLAEADESEELTCGLPQGRCHYPNTCRRKGCCLGALARKVQNRAVAAAEPERAAQ